MAEIIRISPKIDDLHPNRQLKCTQPDCSSIFNNQANLQMHVNRHHHRKSINSGTTTNNQGIAGNSLSIKWYFCPIENCSYYDNGTESNKHFDRLKYVRQHYQKVHAAKAYQCDKCGKTFATEGMRMRHESDCGHVYKCDQCEWVYNSREALLTHIRRKRHVSKLDKPKVDPPKPASSNDTVIIGTQTTTPIQILVKLSTQTQDQGVQTEPVEIKGQQKRKRGSNSSKFAQAKLSKKLKSTSTETNDYPSNLNDLQHSLPTNSIPVSNLNRLSYVGDAEMEDSLNTCLEQLVNSSNGLCDIETQTDHFTSTILDQMLYSHMHTQTCDEFLSELGLADIQTQTNLVGEKDVEELPVDMGVANVRSAYSMTSSGAHDEMLVSTETQTSFTQCLLEYNEAGASSNGITQHTQTCETLLEGLFGGQGSDLIGNFQSAYTQT